jgi:hypothetical protein
MMRGSTWAMPSTRVSGNKRKREGFVGMRQKNDVQGRLQQHRALTFVRERCEDGGAVLNVRSHVTGVAGRQLMHAWGSDDEKTDISWRQAIRAADRDFICQRASEKITSASDA